MNPVLTVSIASTTVLVGLVIFLNERYQLLSSDRFPSATARWFAYGWLFLLLVSVTSSVIGAAKSESPSLDELPFWSIFTMHLLLLVFLVVWWSLAGRKPLKDFLNLHVDELPQSLGIGVAAGVGGWVITICVAVLVGIIAQRTGLLPDDLQPAPMIRYLANLAIWQKVLIVFSAMTVEEFFFRGWLQKRFGLAVSTVIFALAHASYGQPMLLVGVTVISLVIGTTFYFTRRLLPCIIAHGVFDAIQIFIIVPVALQASGLPPS